MRPQPPTPQQVDALARYIQSLRPTWKQVLIVDQLNEAIEAGVASGVMTLTVGAVRYALTATNVDVYHLGARGPQWNTFGFEDRPGARVDSSPRCGRCGGIHDPEGPGDAPGSLCIAPEDQRTADPSERAAAAKAAISEGRTA